MVTIVDREALRAKLGGTAGRDFKPDDAPIVFSLSLEGLEGTGKTHFAINTMPLPIVIVNFGDRSAIPFLYAMPEERRDHVFIYDVQPSSDEGWTFAEAVGGLQTLGEIIRAEAPHMPGGTFVLDGGSSWWSVMQQVFVEPKEQAAAAAGKKKTGGIIYEEANGRARGLLGYLKTTGCYLAMTHQVKQDWDANGPIPGRYSPKRNSQVPYLMEVVLRLFKVCAVCGAPACDTDGHMGRIHKARIEKFAGDTGFEGMIIDDPSFAKVYTLYTGKNFVQRELNDATA